jgi:LacI family transcriptional regulator
MYDAMEARATENGLECHLLRFRSHSFPTAGAKFDRRTAAFKVWVKKIGEPVGIFTYSDRNAALLCTMCLDADLAVPEDVAILGLGNFAMECECAPVSLSSIELDFEALATETVDLLGAPGGRDGLPPRVMIPPKGIVVRESTDVLATRERNVAAAVRFIWDRCERGLSVREIAEAVGVPLRTLQHAFRREIGRSMTAELRRKRLERCCDLLRASDIAIAEIAPLVGFRTPQYLHRVFVNTFGVSPGQYRKREGTAR